MLDSEAGHSALHTPSHLLRNPIEFFSRTWIRISRKEPLREAITVEAGNDV